jgi:hypothetical protein
MIETVDKTRYTFPMLDSNTMQGLIEVASILLAHVALSRLSAQYRCNCALRLATLLRASAH